MPTPSQPALVTCQPCKPSLTCHQVGKAGCGEKGPERRGSSRDVVGRPRGPVGPERGGLSPWAVESGGLGGSPRAVLAVTRSGESAVTPETQYPQQ